jgi:hypothetical protein
MRCHWHRMHNKIFEQFRKVKIICITAIICKKNFKCMRCHWHRMHGVCGVNDTACTIFSFENRSYLGEFEAEFEKASARESGSQGVLFDEKNRRSKISWHCSQKARKKITKVLNSIWTNRFSCLLFVLSVLFRFLYVCTYNLLIEIYFFPCTVNHK